MNEWLKKVIEKIKALWGKWSLVQKLILGGVLLAVIAGIAVLLSVSSSPGVVRLVDTPITDEAARDRIILRLNQENVSVSTGADNLLYVRDEPTARRMRAILVSEDLLPGGIDPWAVFDQERWTITDFERNVNLRRALTEEVRSMIQSLEDVDSASVSINVPDNSNTLFREDVRSTTAAVVITPKPGSDITRNRRKIEGIKRIVQLAAGGIPDENIEISDNNGVLISDFSGMADFDRLTRIEREQKLIAQEEAKIRAKVLKSLQETYGADRVREVNVSIEMDMSEETVQRTEYLPTVIRPDNPETPYDDSEIRESVTLSSETSTTRWQGTGFNPEGPEGVEGQTAPAYRDMSNLYGLTEQSIVKKNELVGQQVSTKDVSPSKGRRTASVNIDGLWTKLRDANGDLILENGEIQREYTPLSAEELQHATLLVQDAIGYDRARGDSISVLNIRFDRTKEFEQENQEYLRRMQTQSTILITLLAIAGLLFVFVMYRMIMREVERRRRLAEEERMRQYQMERDRSILDAENAGMEVSMSVEERRRMELQENAVNMAKEHPENVALLIRTWLMEE